MVITTRMKRFSFQLESKVHGFNIYRNQRVFNLNDNQNKDIQTRFNRNKIHMQLTPLTNSFYVLSDDTGKTTAQLQ